ncbi:LysR family transcriptional regulator [Variovorax sp. HJSM1_2]|uniref:LysR family transcriptional regulator n=1 Tax=Variovorax sp. HJSM1_2 TaxID=3366263 RepID=UPI003BC402EC
MDTRLLKFFMVVAEEGNLGRATHRLHITQPALTRKIQSLEEHFGTPLFTRTTSGMVLTSAGEALAQRAGNILSELELAKSEALRAETETPLRMDIGVYGTAIFNIVPEIIERFCSRHPKVQLALHNTPKSQQIELLRQGKIEIAFDRFFPEEPGLTRLTVCKEPPFVVLHANHPLAQKRSLSLAELSADVFIGTNANVSDADWEKMFGFIPNFGQKVDDILTAVSMVRCGFGVTLAPPSLKVLQIPNVVYKRLAGSPGFNFELHCLYRESGSSSLLDAMLETVREYSAEH